MVFQQAQNLWDDLTGKTAAQQQLDAAQGASQASLDHLRQATQQAAPLYGGAPLLDQSSNLVNAYLNAQDLIAGGAGAAGGALQQGFDPSISLQSFAPQAAQSVSQPGRVGAMLDQGLFSGFETDPGYQFQRDQGEQALERFFAARGGRGGGAAAKEFSRFNQGLAEQSYRDFANRRLAEAGVAGGADTRALQGDLAAQGVQANFANQGFGSGRQLGSSLADLYTRTAGQQAGLETGGAGSLADLYLRFAGGQSGALLGTAPQITQAFQSAVPYAGGPAAAQSGMLRDLLRLGVAVGTGGG